MPSKKKKVENVIPICLYCGKKRHRPNRVPKFCQTKERLMPVLAASFKTNQMNVFLAIKAGQIDIDAGTKMLMKQDRLAHRS